MRPSVVVFAAFVVIATSLLSLPAYAQAARTFVAATGNDAGACTRAQPCRTLQAAHNKTKAGGEINVLGPADYAPVKIGKAISVVSDGPTPAIVLVPAGGTGIAIDAGADDVVTLRGLIVDGATTGSFGIVFNTGRSLTIDRLTVRNVTLDGVLLQPKASSTFALSNSTFMRNSVGVHITPRGTDMAVSAIFSRVDLLANVVRGLAINGTASTGRIEIAVTDSLASNNGGAGFAIEGSDGHSATNLTLIRSVSAANQLGVQQEGKPAPLSAPATISVGQSALAGNAIGWLGGRTSSFGDNYIAGNGPSSAPLGNVQKQ